MVVPHDIAPSDPLDARLILPLPSKLPSTSTAPLETVLAALEAHLDPSAADGEPIPTALLAAQMRLISRNAHASVNASRFEAARARQALEKRTVEYESARIRQEIQRCEGYMYVRVDADVCSSPAIPSSFPCHHH